MNIVRKFPTRVRVVGVSLRSECSCNVPPSAVQELAATRRGLMKLSIAIREASSCGLAASLAMLVHVEVGQFATVRFWRGPPPSTGSPPSVMRPSDEGCLRAFIQRDLAQARSSRRLRPLRFRYWMMKSWHPSPWPATRAGQGCPSQMITSPSALSLRSTTLQFGIGTPGKHGVSKRGSVQAVAYTDANRILSKKLITAQESK